MSFKQDIIDTLMEKKRTALRTIEVNNQTISVLTTKIETAQADLAEIKTLLKAVGVEDFTPGKKVWHRDYSYPVTIVGRHPNNDRLVEINVGAGGNLYLSKKYIRFSE